MTSRTLVPETPPSGVDRVRRRLLGALHSGALTPGDRAPSVRRLAGLTGMNRKTVHRAYTRLADEGWLDVRPGSGTFIAADLERSVIRPVDATSLAEAVRDTVDSAARLGLDPGEFARVLTHHASRRFEVLRPAFAAADLETLGLAALDLKLRLGLDVRPVLLDESVEPGAGAFGDARAVIVAGDDDRRLARRIGADGPTIHRTTMDREFPGTVASVAERGPVVVIVRDVRIEAALLAAVDSVADDSTAVARVEVLDATAARRRLARPTAARPTVHVSPLIAPSLGAGFAERHRILTGRWGLDRSSVAALHAALALECARRSRA